MKKYIMEDEQGNVTEIDAALVDAVDEVDIPPQDAAVALVNLWAQYLEVEDPTESDDDRLTDQETFILEKMGYESLETVIRLMTADLVTHIVELGDREGLSARDALARWTEAKRDFLEAVTDES